LTIPRDTDAKTAAIGGFLGSVFVTGYAKNAIVGNGHLDTGMHLIAKSFNMSEFANKVREMIEE
jgi:hypothetical protein